MTTKTGDSPTSSTVSGYPVAPPAEEEGKKGAEARLVGLLTMIFALSFIDRGALNLIVQPIIQDLHITDLQMSYLLGLSFAILYSVLSIPAGHLADLFSRRLIIGVAAFFWSCMAALCGFANSYWQLFVGRMGLGVGEAGLPPAAYSLLRDGVAPQRRAFALSVYNVGPLFGNGLGALIGGSLYAAASHGAFAGVPVVNTLKPWQIVIVIPGLIGMPLSLLLLLVKEPPRPPVAAKGEPASFSDMFAYVGQHWRLYAPLFGIIIFGSMGLGWNTWLPAALSRVWGLSPSVLGKVMGPLAMVITPVTFVAIGRLMDHFSRDGRTDRVLRISIIAILVNLPPTLGILLAPTVPTMWTMYVLSLIFTSGLQIAGGVVLTTVTPPRLIGKVSAFFFLAGNLLGLATGPTVYALVSQHFFRGSAALAHAMLVCYPALMGIVLILTWITAGQVRHWAGRQSDNARPIE